MDDSSVAVAAWHDHMAKYQVEPVEAEQMKLSAPTVELGGQAFWAMMLRLVMDPTNRAPYRQNGVSVVRFTEEGLRACYPVISV